MRDPTAIGPLARGELASLCATVSGLLPHLLWRENGLGLLQGYLIEGGGREVRVHVWSPRLERPGMRGNGNIHDHRFDIVSRVLVGAVHHGHVVPVEGESGTSWQMCEVVHARKAHAEKGTFDCKVSQLPGLFTIEVSDHDITAGHIYRFPRGEFHESFSDELTVTLIEKCEQRDDMSARVLWPASQRLTHAFGGPPSGEMEAVLAEAQQALIEQWEALG